MTPRVFIPILLIIFLSPVQTRAGNGPSKDSLDQAKAEIRKAMDSGQIEGASHMVLHEGKVVHFDVVGYRDIKARKPLEKDTIMRIYSMTKPITSVTAMILFEQGKFQLDDPVAKYIPSFASTTVLAKGAEKPVPANRLITVRDVFRHTTGYSYGDSPPRINKYYEKEGMLYRPPAEMMPPAMSIKQAAEALARIPALHHPGEKFTYGYNTDLLGRLIEVWSGQPLDRFMKSAIFLPLGMNDTGFVVAPEQRNRFASCHGLEDKKLIIVDPADTSPFTKGFEFLSGGGGLVSTMTDYGNFCQMMTAEGLYQGKRILKKSTINKMFTDQLSDVEGDFKFGLGFAIEEVTLGQPPSTRKATQYSWGGYASTHFRIIPEENLIQIFMRQKVPYSEKLAKIVFPIVFEGMK